MGECFRQFNRKSSIILFRTLAEQLDSSVFNHIVGVRGCLQIAQSRLGQRKEVWLPHSGQNLKTIADVKQLDHARNFAEGKLSKWTVLHLDVRKNLQHPLVVQSLGGFESSDCPKRSGVTNRTFRQWGHKLISHQSPGGTEIRGFRSWGGHFD